MLIKVTSKRQVTFPARVLEAMGVGPGDRLSLEEGPHGVPAASATSRSDAAWTSQGHWCAGKPSLDMQTFREATA